MIIIISAVPSTFAIFVILTSSTRSGMRVDAPSPHTTGSGFGFWDFFGLGLGFCGNNLFYFS